MTKIVCIGAGASGVIAITHLLAEGFNGELLLLGKPFGPAYETPEPYHILNVTLGNMSALASDPSHFHRFAKARSNNPLLPKEAFVPRRLFRDYLETLMQNLKDRGAKHLEDEAIAIHENNGHYIVKTKDALSIEADAVILAIGNFPAAPLPGSDTLTSQQYIGAPWDKNIASDLDPKANVLFVGAGLTMVDGAITLQRHRHRGKIMAISRRGLLPLTRTVAEPLPITFESLPKDSISRLMRALRQATKKIMQQGEPWDRVVDGVRPFLQRLWLALPVVEKKRFLRHACAYWDIHRHRIPKESSDILQALLSSGQLEIMAARLVHLKGQTSSVEVALRRRGENTIDTITVDRVINCTGPIADYTQVQSPLLQHLFDDGLARPHPLRLGFDATPEGRLFNREDVIQDRLVTLGPPLKGVLWETVAVPEIRNEAQTLAKALLAALVQ